MTWCMPFDQMIPVGAMQTAGLGGSTGHPIVLKQIDQANTHYHQTVAFVIAENQLLVSKAQTHSIQ